MKSRSKTYTFKCFNFDIDNERSLLLAMLENFCVAHMYVYIDDRMGGNTLVGFVHFRSLMSVDKFTEFVGERKGVDFTQSLEPLNDLVIMKRFVTDSLKPRTTHEAGDMRLFAFAKLRLGTKRQKCFVRWWKGTGKHKVGKRIVRGNETLKSQPGAQKRRVAQG